MDPKVADGSNRCCHFSDADQEQEPHSVNQYVSRFKYAYNHTMRFILTKCIHVAFGLAERICAVGSGRDSIVRVAPTIVLRGIKAQVDT